MKNIEDKYDKLISCIKTITPEPDDPREITDNILSAIKELPIKPKVSRTLYLSAWISSAAAISLILLFLSVYKTPLPNYQSRVCTPVNITYSQQSIGGMTNINKEDIISIATEIKRKQKEAKNRQHSLQNYVLINKLNN